MRGYVPLFEEFVQNDNSTEAKIRRYLERKEKERKERHDRMLHPSDKEDLQDLIIEEIKKKGPNVDLNHIDVSEIEDMSSLFSSYYKGIQGWGNENSILNSFCGDISEWDVSSVTNMGGMFVDCGNFNCNISKWDVSSVEIMTGMFNGATSFNQDISGWNVGKVKDMAYMFYAAFEFDCPIGKWNVGDVTNMQSMFEDAHRFNQPLEEWKDKVEGRRVYMNRMFNGALKFDQNLSMWNLDINDVGGMFGGKCPIKEENKPHVSGTLNDFRRHLNK